MLTQWEQLTSRTSRWPCINNSRASVKCSCENSTKPACCSIRWHICYAHTLLQACSCLSSLEMIWQPKNATKKLLHSNTKQFFTAWQNLFVNKYNKGLLTMIGYADKQFTQWTNTCLMKMAHDVKVRLLSKFEKK